MIYETIRYNEEPLAKRSKRSFQNVDFSILISLCPKTMIFLSKILRILKLHILSEASL